MNLELEDLTRIRFDKSIMGYGVKTLENEIELQKDVIEQKSADGSIVPEERKKRTDLLWSLERQLCHERYNAMRDGCAFCHGDLHCPDMVFSMRTHDCPNCTAQAIISQAIGERYADYTLEKIAKNRPKEVSDVRIFLNARRSFAISGSVGTGKTVMITAIFRELKSNHENCDMLSYTDIISAIRDRNADRSEYDLRKNQLCKEKKVILIDDFGVGELPSFISEDLFAWINKAYNLGSQIIVTSNLFRSDLEKVLGVGGARIVDRIFENQIILTGKSLRCLTK